MVDNINVRSLYHLVCLASTIGLLFYCGWKFIQNKSNALVDFRSFHQEDIDIYPSFSICIQNVWHSSLPGIFNATKLKNMFGVEMVNEYVQFLQGRHWNETMVNINYDDVTINLENYIDRISVTLNRVNAPYSYLWETTTTKTSTHVNGSSKSRMIPFPFYISQRNALQKCFTLDFTSEIFGEIKDQKISLLQFETSKMKALDITARYYIHYPNQLLRAVQLDYEFGYSGVVAGGLESKYIWIHNIEIIRRRDTFNTPCNTNSFNDMDMINSELSDEMQCKPPHWLDVEFPVCNDSQSIKKFDVNYDIPDSNFTKSWPRPCDQVQTASFSIQEIDWNEKIKEVKDNPNGTSTFGIVYNSHDYREIKHIQDFNLESLIGNIGGYIGLFLGFAFWQIPDTLNSILHKFDRTSPN